MHLASVRTEAQELAAVVLEGKGVALVRDLLPGLEGDLLEVLRREAVPDLRAAVEGAAAGAFRSAEQVEFAAPYRRPRLIWGIGLNYVEHAGDLAEGVPDEPASFIKGDHTVIGPGEDIPIPVQSQRTTAEAELGLVIGRRCRNVEPEEALDHLIGVTTVLDQTAEDILQRNPRFLTRAKNFPGFFSFGPRIVPLDDAVRAAGGALGDVEVSTVINDRVHRRNTVSNMMFDPAYLISFHSKVMPLYPGDIISSGTPGAVRIHPGDVVQCRIPGVGVLTNPVVSGQESGA